MPCGQNLLSEGHIADKITLMESGIVLLDFRHLTGPHGKRRNSYSGLLANEYLLLPGMARLPAAASPTRPDEAFGVTVLRSKLGERGFHGYRDVADNGNKAIILNFMTAHQKWGIHSTYYDNERMLTLSRGGPVVWMSDIDAANAGIVDNDWIECWNANGAVVGRAIVSSRMPEGLCVTHHVEKTVDARDAEVTGLRGSDP